MEIEGPYFHSDFDVLSRSDRVPFMEIKRWRKSGKSAVDSKYAKIHSLKFIHSLHIYLNVQTVGL